jgi:hypothetical protein
MARIGRRARDDAGTGLVASVVGVAVFLILLLLAVQVIFDLYARSAVTAAALDAASAVAGSDGGGSPAAQADAVANARAILGRYGTRASFTWQITPAAVELTVSVRNPSVLPSFAAAGLGLDRVSRSVVVNTERIRP